MTSLAQIRKMKELYTRKIERESSDIISGLESTMRIQRKSRRNEVIAVVNGRLDSTRVTFEPNGEYANLSINKLVTELNTMETGVTFRKARYDRDITFSLKDVTHDESFDVRITEVNESKEKLILKLDDWEMEAVSNKSELPTFDITFE